MDLWGLPCGWRRATALKCSLRFSLVRVSDSVVASVAERFSQNLRRSVLSDIIAAGDGL